MSVGVFATCGPAGGRAGGIRTLLQPARAQCLRFFEHFLNFHLSIVGNSISVHFKLYFSGMFYRYVRLCILHLCRHWYGLTQINYCLI